jgi:hypothetical protein
VISLPRVHAKCRVNPFFTMTRGVRRDLENSTFAAISLREASTLTRSRTTLAAEVH